MRRKNVHIYTVTEDKMFLRRDISTTEPAVAMVRHMIINILHAAY